MTRGKQQILFNYLPNRTFDFGRVAAIARVVSIRGESRTDLNATILLRRIKEEVNAWPEESRPALRDDVLEQTNRFVLIEPRSVQSELFPRVLWCQNHECSHIFDYSQRDPLPHQCPVCNQGRLVQLRFVRIHRCGALKPLLPPLCRRCNTRDHMSLDTRGSERISNFRWVCRQCNLPAPLFGGHCGECQWPDEMMDIEVHRAGRTYYSHNTVLLNIPHRSLDSFFSLPEWSAIVAAKYLGLPEVLGRPLSDYGQESQSGPDTGLSGADLDELMGRCASGELSPEQLAREIEVIRARRHQERLAHSPGGIVSRLTQCTGVPWPIWEASGQEMLEAIMPLETGRPIDLNLQNPTEPGGQVARQIGLSRLTLVSDYPILTATYGFSRAEFEPTRCRLNPFPASPDHGGRIPVFVDQVQADALLLSLSPDRVFAWLEQNACRPIIPSGTEPSLARRAYFVQLFNRIHLRETLRADNKEARMVFGLIHTFSHVSVRQAALLCGLDRTSLSEYVLPRALTFAIYCNHRFGATIGALTALFEQALAEWLKAIRDTRRCVYDPVCRDSGGNCHACTHLAETSCRFFNLNLSRAFLFGGHDKELGDIHVGYFNPALP